MAKMNFEDVVRGIVTEDSRFHPNAYLFVREGLDYTLKLQKRSRSTPPRHVSGAELLDGLRLFTLKEFGPMAKIVLNEWGITCCEDFGRIVFNLVQKGVLGTSESDKLEDFSEIFSFDEAFVKPFLPTKPVRSKTSSRRKNSARSHRVSAAKSQKPVSPKE